VKIEPELRNVMKNFQIGLGQGESMPFVALSRFHWMNPSGPSEALAQFKEQFRRTGSYFLMPGCPRGGILSPRSKASEF
jgi:hypothetical protein